VSKFVASLPRLYNNLLIKSTTDTHQGTVFRTPKDENRPLRH